MSRYTTTGAWVRGVAEFLAAQGLDVRALCASAGIDPAWLDGSDERLSSDLLSLLWEHAAKVSGNSAIALAMPSTRPTHFEVVGYAMMTCPNLLAGLERLVRYARIVSESASVALAEGDEGCSLSFELQAGERAVPRQRYEFCMLSLLSFCRWAAGREIAPLRVEFTHGEPPDRAPYRTAFCASLRFDAPTHRLLFRRDDLLAPLPTSNPRLAELHDRFAGERMVQLGHARVSERARDLIVRKLPAGEPRREEVASQLFMSERTLQRRLQDEGTSFQQLLDDTRKELTRRYLRQR